MQKTLIYLSHWINEFFLALRDHSPRLHHILDLMTLFLASAVRAFGASRGHAGNLQACRRPQKPLELYDLHGCPYCAKVRNALHYLQLDHIVYPCPKESFKQQGACINSRFRPKAKSLGGKCVFPMLVDPNKLTSANTDDSVTANSGGGLVMYESSDIVDYLWREYGHQAQSTWFYRLMNQEPIRSAVARTAAVLRPCLNMGIFRAPSRQPERHLEFYGADGNPFCTRVQETLATLELPYIFHVDNTSKAACSKVSCCSQMPLHEMVKMLGPMFSQPTLKDPNTGVDLKDSAKIVQYLRITYQTAPVPAEKWTDYLTA